MERLIKFEPLTEAEANFFGSLEQYFFAEFPNKKILELSPMQCMHRDEGWYYNFLDKIILTLCYRERLHIRPLQGWCVFILWL